MKVGFFRALYGSCAGISIFEKLREQGFARAVCHLLLMSILSAAIIGCGVFPEVKRSVSNSLDVVADNCGSIICTDKSIKPSVAPDTVKTFVLTGPVAVTYLPENATALPEDFHKACSTGVLWSADGKFLLWNALNQDKYSVVSLWPPAVSGEAMVMGRAGLLAELKKLPAVKLKLKPGVTREISTGKLRAFTDLAVNAVLIGYLLRKTLLEVIIYIAMFAGVTVLMNLGRPRRSPLKELVVLAIYAGFPPMLIGSAAEALRLPFLNFNMIYVLGMTFYLIVIMNRLERLRQEQQWREEGQ